MPSRGGEGGGERGGVLWPAAADERGVDTKLSDRRMETGVFFPNLFCRWRVLVGVVLTDLEGMSCFPSPVPVMRALGH